MHRRTEGLDYSLRTHKTSRLGQQHDLQSTTLTSYYYKKYSLN
jgi:hypothetical protein